MVHLYFPCVQSATLLYMGCKANYITDILHGHKLLSFYLIEYSLFRKIFQTRIIDFSNVYILYDVTFSINP
jgi:hypothetical protein